MRNYTIILIPESSSRIKLEDLRVKHTGQKLVDSLPPHLVLKRRFSLNNGFSEDDLKDLFDNFNLEKITVVFNDVGKMQDAIVLFGKNDYVEDNHKKIVGILGSKVATQNPEYETDNFKPHLTLFRGKDIKSIDDPDLNKIVFDEMCLYELDPTPNRSFANVISCKKLS